jgi:hypothetical protein
MWRDGGGVGAEVGPISFAVENCVPFSEVGGFDARNLYLTSHAPVFNFHGRWNRSI